MGRGSGRRGLGQSWGKRAIRVCTWGADGGHELRGPLRGPSEDPPFKTCTPWQPGSPLPPIFFVWHQEAKWPD